MNAIAYEGMLERLVGFSVVEHPVTLDCLLQSATFSYRIVCMLSIDHVLESM